MIDNTNLGENFIAEFCNVNVQKDIHFVFKKFLSALFGGNVASKKKCSGDFEKGSFRHC